MIPKKIVENLVDNDVYIYIKNIAKEFAGKIISITEADLVVLEDKNNNLAYIPISEISVITERRWNISIQGTTNIRHEDRK